MDQGPENRSQDRRNQIDPQIGGLPGECGRTELAGGVDRAPAEGAKESDHQPDGQSDDVRQQANIARTGYEVPDDKDQDHHASRLGEKDRRGLPRGCGPDRGVSDRREGDRTPPHQAPETRSRRGTRKLSEHVGQDTATGEGVHQPQGDRHGGIHVPPAASAGRGEDQPGEDGPAENADDSECDVQVGDVKGGAWITQPPDDSHRDEQQDGGERELVGGTRQARCVLREAFLALLRSVRRHTCNATHPVVRE